jgi:hypothetical protein
MIQANTTYTETELERFRDKRWTMAYFGFSASSLERAMRDQTDPLPHYKLGNLCRFDPAECREWARRRRAQRGDAA